MNCPIPNESLIDRLFRVLLALSFFILAYFWLWSYWQIAAYIVSAILAATAAMGFCGLYKLFGWDTTKLKWHPKAKIIWPIFAVVFILLASGGSYASMFFTRKFFLEDYNRMNNSYKQTLFTTGQGQREISISNYGQLVTGYGEFMGKYAAYHPYFLRKDARLADDLRSVQGIIADLKATIVDGDLQEAHKKLEQIRPIFQDMLKRNGFSMLAVYLVDFHDSMEKVITAADAKDAAGVLETYKEADAKLKDVESAANDSEIQAIRARLEELSGLAGQGKADDLSAKAAELKSSFVKVYLTRG